MYAVIETGGRQFRVRKGDCIVVDKMNEEVGKEHTIESVLALGEGSEIKIGQPYVDSAKVKAEVIAQERGEKIIVFHKKRRQQYQKKQGHRQPYTRLLITEVGGESLSADEKKQILGRVGFALGDNSKPKAPRTKLTREQKAAAKEKAEEKKAKAPKKKVAKAAKKKVAKKAKAAKKKTAAKSAEGKTAKKKTAKKKATKKD